MGDGHVSWENGLCVFLATTLKLSNTRFCTDFQHSRGPGLIIGVRQEVSRRRVDYRMSANAMRECPVKGLLAQICLDDTFMRTVGFCASVSCSGSPPDLIGLLLTRLSIFKPLTSVVGVCQL